MNIYGIINITSGQCWYPEGFHSGWAADQASRVMEFIDNGRSLSTIDFLGLKVDKITHALINSNIDKEIINVALAFPKEDSIEVRKKYLKDAHNKFGEF